MAKSRTSSADAADAAAEVVGTESPAEAEPAGDAPESGPAGESAEGEPVEDPDLRPHLEELEELIRENPLLSVGLAAGVGIVLGLLLNRR